MRRAVLALALVVACRAQRAPEQVAVEPVVIKPVLAQPPVTPLGPSIYDLELPLRDSHGQKIGLDVHRGHPTLVAMFYASCPVACPVLISEVRSTLEELGRSDARVLLVSFDPARDTPEKLSALVAERGLDDRWAVAAASEADAQTLAAVLGVKYRRIASGEFAHGATIVALDGEGRPVARADRLGQRDALVSALVR
ncbi:MAG: SCO family protein [Casimicrobiaceae bacterium]